MYYAYQGSTQFQVRCQNIHLCRIEVYSVVSHRVSHLLNSSLFKDKYSSSETYIFYWSYFQKLFSERVVVRRASHFQTVHSFTFPLLYPKKNTWLKVRSLSETTPSTNGIHELVNPVITPTYIHLIRCILTKCDADYLSVLLLQRAEICKAQYQKICTYHFRQIVTYSDIPRARRVLPKFSR